MYPVADVALPQGFESILETRHALEFTPQRVAAQRRAWIVMAARRQPLIWLADSGAVLPPR